MMIHIFVNLIVNLPIQKIQPASMILSLCCAGCMHASQVDAVDSFYSLQTFSNNLKNQMDLSDSRVPYSNHLFIRLRLGD